MERPTMNLVMPEFVACDECGEMWDPRALTAGLCSGCRPARIRPARATIDVAPLIPPRHLWALELDLPESLSGWIGEPWCVTFKGPNGAGKTSQATRLFAEAVAAIDAEAERRLPPPVWISGKRFVHQLRESVNGGESPVDSMLAASVLLLDDVRATERGDSNTAYVAEQLELVLCERYDWMRPTILTTDKEISEIAPRLVSRVVYHGRVILIEGDDWRKRS